MKINQSPLDQTGVSQLGRTGTVGSSGPGRGGQTRPDRDRVQLSDLSSHLLAMAEAGGADRSARVQQLSADYRAGRYQVDAHELSRCLVDEAIRQ